MTEWQPALSNSPQDLAAIERELSEALLAHRRVGELTAESAADPRHWFQKLLRRSLAWYTRPIQLFQGSVLRLFRRFSTAAEAHEAAISGLTTAVEQLRQQHTSLEQQHAALREGSAAVNEKLGDLESQVRATAVRTNMLRENDTVIDYWDRAASKDAMRETVTQWADQSDEQYREKWKEEGEYVARKIMSYSPPNPVALEIGPGMGRISIPMAKYCQSILALDISPVMARRAQQAMAQLQNFTVQLITDEDLSFLPEEHFDLAYSIACFQHAEKKTFYRYLEGIRRALKPDGVLFFGVMNLCCDLGWKHFSAIVKNDYPEFFHTPDEISCYLQRAGYRSHRLVEEGETLWAIALR